MSHDMKVAVVAAVAGAVVGAVLGFLLSYWLFRLTNPTPKITITITPPQQDPGDPKVKQLVTLANSGEAVVKGVNFELRSIGARLERSPDGSISGLMLIFAPPRVQPPTTICTNNGDCNVPIGDLQPNSYVTVKILYLAPQLREDEFEIYADNAKISKVTSHLQQ
jgi:hypothetical protein